MPKDLRLEIRLTADGKGFVGEVRVARREIDKLSDVTRRSGDANRRFNRSAQATETANKSLSSSFLKAHGSALKYIGTGALIAGGTAITRSIIQTGLEVEAAEQRFRVATGSAATAQEEIAFFRAEAERLGLAFVR